MRAKYFIYGIAVGMMFIFMLLFASGNAQKVVKVYDGDTFLLASGERIRLAEIDCPEISQAFGLRAKGFTEAWILGKQVQVVKGTTDKYGRVISEVYIKNQWLNKLLVVNGLAWVYRSYGSSYLYSLFLDTKYKKRGLWAEAYEPPFIYRKKNKIL